MAISGTFIYLYYLCSREQEREVRKKEFPREGAKKEVFRADA